MFVKTLLHSVVILNQLGLFHGQTEVPSDCETHLESDYDIWVDGDWDYDIFGPDTWGACYPVYCGADYDTQSPISIDTSTTVNGFDHIDDFILSTVDQHDSDLFHHWQWQTDHDTWFMENNGHSVSLIASTTSDTYLNDKDSTVAVLTNFFPEYKDEHIEYCLYGIHMHWGANSSYGSEHRIDGTYYPLEMHFVHFSCNFTDISDAISNFSLYNDTLDLAVVGILFELSTEDNQDLNPIFDNLASISGYDETYTVQGLNFYDVLSIFKTNSDFWYYEGSLTTPPCDPIVRWHVLEKPLTVSANQLAKFGDHLVDHENHQLSENWRPVQDNINTVYDFVFGDSGGIMYHYSYVCLFSCLFVMFLSM